MPVAEMSELRATFFSCHVSSDTVLCFSFKGKSDG